MSTTPVTIPVAKPSLPPGPTRPQLLRTARWALGILAVLTTLILGIAQLIDPSTTLLSQITQLNQLLPAISLVAAIIIVRPGAALRTIALSPVRPLRNSLGGSLVALLILAVAPTFTLLVCIGLGIMEGQVPEAWPSLLALVVPVMLVLLVPCLAEEVLWRGWLQSAWAHWGWLRSSLTIAVIWLVWHLPLMAIYAVAGVTRWEDLLVLTANMLCAGLLLSALRLRFSSVWPAAVGHASLNTFFPLIQSNFIVGGIDSSTASTWAFVAISCVTLLGATFLVYRSGPRAIDTVTAQPAGV